MNTCHIAFPSTRQWLALIIAGLAVAVNGNAPLVAQSEAEARSAGDQATEDGPIWTWTASNQEQDAAWKFMDPDGWKFSELGGERVLNQFQKGSDYKPPHRSPLHMALANFEVPPSFQLDAWVKSTHPEYGHRDVCLFLNHQGADRFYYLHMASKMDDHANQIFVVDRADRVKISKTTTAGTPWNDDWHHVRIVRKLPLGTIDVYFDDMNHPIMTAEDARFSGGRIGLGSFDDTAAFKRVEIRRR